MLEILSENIEE